MPDTSQARQITLQIDGQVYGGWKSAGAAIGMDRAAGDFSLEVTELWPGEDVSRAIRPGAACKLAVAGETVIDGYVDVVQISLDASQHMVTIAGRDRAADLIDCSAVRSPGQWKGQRVEAIAGQLAEPFGVKVTADVDTGKALKDFALQTGESAYEAIDRAARYRGLLVVSDGAGGIVLTRAGLKRANDSITYGDNLLSARASFDVRDRYRDYTALGQASGSNLFSGTSASQIKATASDPGITRYRPLLLTGEGPDQAGSLNDRVRWEANIRAARSMQVELQVQGFTQSNGELWRPNRLVHVKALPLRLDDDMLISSVSFEVSDQGTFTRIAATRADAFTLKPLKEPTGAPRQYFDRVGTVR